MFASKEDLEAAKKSLKLALDDEETDEEEKKKARAALKALGDPDYVDDDHDEKDEAKAQARAYATLSYAEQAELDRGPPVVKRVYLKALATQLAAVDTAKREKGAAIHARLSPVERELLERTNPSKAGGNRPTFTGNAFTMPQNISRAEAAALLRELEQEGV